MIGAETRREKKKEKEKVNTGGWVLRDVEEVIHENRSLLRTEYGVCYQINCDKHKHINVQERERERERERRRRRRRRRRRPSWKTEARKEFCFCDDFAGAISA
jgi:hypothetical protein